MQENEHESNCWEAHSSQKLMLKKLSVPDGRDRSTKIFGYFGPTASTRLQKANAHDINVSSQSKNSQDLYAPKFP